jgi:hypothetical protein
MITRTVPIISFVLNGWVIRKYQVVQGEERLAEIIVSKPHQQ